jgi:hypothetical protein
VRGPRYPTRRRAIESRRVGETDGFNWTGVLCVAALAGCATTVAVFIADLMNKGAAVIAQAVIP